MRRVDETSRRAQVVSLNAELLTTKGNRLTKAGLSRERRDLFRCRYARLDLRSSGEISGLDLRNEFRKKLTLLRAVEVESYPHSIVCRPYRFCHARKGDGVGVNVD